MYCKYCNKEAKNSNSLRQHEVRCSANPNRINTNISDVTRKKISESMKNNTNGQHQNLTKKEREIISIRSKKINKEYWTTEKRNAHSLLMKKIVLENPESYSINNVSGRVKNYNYNGVILKGTWELKIAKLLDESCFNWTNNIIPTPYYWNNEWHLYFPDFYLEDIGLFIEVKGYQRERDIAKWLYFKKPLLIIKKNEINKLIKNKITILDLIANYKTSL